MVCLRSDSTERAGSCGKVIRKGVYVYYASRTVCRRSRVSASANHVAAARFESAIGRVYIRESVTPWPARLRQGLPCR